MKLGVSQKQASPYASAAAASALPTRKSDPASVNSINKQQQASASAATQLVNVTAASRIAAANTGANPGVRPACHTAMSASGIIVRPALCGPSPYFTSACRRQG